MPSKRTLPVARAAFGNRRITVSAVIDLPEPDLPTRPITSPGPDREIDAFEDRSLADRQRKPFDLQQAHRARLSFGSSVSERPSPRRLRPSTVRMMAKPGKSARWGARIIRVCASNSMRPQLGIGGCAPSPT